MRFGQFLFLILFLLVALALVGVVDWSTVGGWGMFMLILAVAGPVIGLFGYIYFKMKEKAEDGSAAKIKSKFGKIINWLIILTGLTIVAFIFISGYLGNL